MKQNTLSIDFKFARVSGNTYTFGYDVYRSVTTSTEITVQNWNNKAAIPAYYDKPNQRLYAYGVNGYWDVFADRLTFTSVSPDSERIDALITRVDTLETSVTSLTASVALLTTSVGELEASVSNIVSALNNATVYRRVSGKTVTFDSAFAGNANEIIATILPSLTGYTSVSVERYGRNLWPFGSRTFNTRETNTFQTPLPSGTYTLSAVVTSADTTETESLAIVSATGDAYLMFPRGTRASATVTGSISTVTLYASTGWNTSYNKDATWADIQLESGSTASAFQPHDTYTFQFTDGANTLTVYGGTLALTPTSATLTVTHGHIASYNGETVPDGWISSTGELSTGAEIVYPLSPIDYQTYQLTAIPISLFSGGNVISTNASSIDVVYPSKITME